MIDQKNTKKLNLLASLEIEEFNLWNSIELANAAEELKAPWEFPSESLPTLEEYLSTFPSFASIVQQQSAVKYYGRVNARIRVIGYEGKTRQGRTEYKCECQCGKITKAKLPEALLSCGCLKTPLNAIKARERSVAKLEQVVGEKHNRLTIVGVSPERVSKKGMVLVKCDCGESEEFSVVYQSLIPRGRHRKVNTISCGCYEREQVRDRHRKNALQHVNKQKHHLRIEALDGYDLKTKKQLAHATCLACNSDVIIRLNDFLTGRNKSCGCLETLGAERKSYNGSRSFYLEVLDDVEDRITRGGRAVRFVRCKCHACGKDDYEVRLDNIINQQQISCGCQQSIRKDNLISFLTDPVYANRESTTYLVEAEVQNRFYLKVGIAFNFQNRKAVAKISNTHFVKTIGKVVMERSKSWLIEQIILSRLQKYRMMTFRGKVSGGTEMFDQRLREDVLVKIFEEEIDAAKSMSFEARLASLNCEIPTLWIRGLYDR